ncbi:hypothetical protein [Myxococcus sp. SDU36]|uniref:hypothetical protein n=1 Tax=Myxococcus sp. SDU36 TaxID=2831967 RepID=UPI002543A91C|nr:hypothetical protein [Myxococcus sp. SDU36]WIG94090.1 hypothetical protein KGD87_26545 [Myxococcus sp. SDU36]
MNLTIISYPEKPNTHYENIALSVRQGSRNKAAFFARFQAKPERLRFAIRSSALPSTSSRTLVKYLDLVGHGTLGNGFMLGTEPIITNNTLRSDFREILDGVLPKEDSNAHRTIIRLLGCLTGVGLPGHRMLQSVSSALGNREVLGVTTVVKSENFDIGGLKEDFTHFASSRARDPSEAKVIPDSAIIDPYIELLPKGYVYIGPGHPIALFEHEILTEMNHAEPSNARPKISFKYACENNIIMVTDGSPNKPWVYQWARGGPAPAPRLNEP